MLTVETLLEGRKPQKRPSSTNPLILRLGGEPFSRVAISPTPSIPELLAGFIGTETEVISPRARVFSNPNRHLGPDDRRTTIALFDEGITNPDALRELVDASKIKGPWREVLRRLAMYSQDYRTGRDEFARAQQSKIRILEIIDKLIGDNLRDYLRKLITDFNLVRKTVAPETPPEPSDLLTAYPHDADRKQLRQWVETMGSYSAAKNPGQRAREAIIRGGNASWLGLNDLLTVTLLSHVDQPVLAYQRGQELLTRLYELGPDEPEPSEFGFLAPIRVEVPVLKSREGEPDRIDHTGIIFDRSMAMLLRQTNQAIFVMGPAHSGKSTLVACLLTQMQTDLSNCVRAGLIREDEVTVTSYNYDLTSPTVDTVLGGQEKSRSSLRWSQPLAQQARRGLEEYLKNYNIVIVDFPGGDPDDITQILASNCGSCSILVGAYGNDHLQLWEQFIIKEGLPVNQVRVTTHPLSGNRTSALVKYSRIEAGDKRTFLDLRVVGLDLKVKQDPTISLLSKFLLFRSLTESQLERIRYQHQLLSQAAL